ncbi:uncharacterized protein LOC129287089 [Prosopis cineraria]|uniref:uncharacterized protein LOC129287089 n=1 Tax=Prosopis cineraria TaxID=364024 RepID=UPI00240F79FF|nr:uncharacterized protein LOC129287089 [Prosopis cineraria]
MGTETERHQNSRQRRKPGSMKNGQKEESSGSKRTWMEHLCTLPIIHLLSKKKVRGERDLNEKVDPETKPETKTVRHQNCRESKKMREPGRIKNGQKEESRGSKRTWMEHIEQCLNFICKWPILRHLHIRATNGEEEEKEGSNNDQKMLIAKDDDIKIEETSSNSEKKAHMTDDDDERRVTNIKEQGISYSKWSQVGDDILGLVLEHLCLSDYLRSRAVCSSWQSIVSKYVAKKQCLPQPELPLLYLQTMDSQNFPFFILPTASVFKFNYTVPPLEFIHYCYGTVQGWMIMIEASRNYFDVPETDVQIFFFNPVTKAKVYLSSRLKVKSKIKRIVASTNPNDPNCVVVCIFYLQNIFAFRWISDESWTIVVEDLMTRITFMHVEILHGKLYALTNESKNSLISYDLKKQPLKPEILARLPLVVPNIIRTEIVPPCYLNEVRPRYFIEANDHILRTLAVDSSSGELLLIYLYYTAFFTYNCGGHEAKEFANPPEIVDSKVFKLDMSDEPSWTEVENLESLVLFVGYWKTLALSLRVAPHIPQEFIKENCIYFSYRFPCIEGTDKWKGLKIGRHCRTERRIEYYAFERSSFTDVPCPVWFIPNL